MGTTVMAAGRRAGRERTGTWTGSPVPEDRCKTAP